MNTLEPRRRLRSHRLAPGMVPLAVILLLALWGDVPQSFIAGLLPGATPAGRGAAINTPLPTHTPTVAALLDSHPPTAGASEVSFTWPEGSDPALAAAATHERTLTQTVAPVPASSREATPAAPLRPTRTPTSTPAPLASWRSGKWIEIDLSKQRLYAHDGKLTVFVTRVSSGTQRFPTVTGRFKVYAKYPATRMRGPGYDLPNVPWTMFFHSGYAIHGAYWHNNFGRPMSHGCVNMKVSEAKWLYDWSPKGTVVVIHR